MRGLLEISSYCERSCGYCGLRVENRDLPRYRIVSQAGPDHEKVFEVEALIKERAFPPASGRTKKEAEQGAAANALEVLRAEEDPACES